MFALINLIFTPCRIQCRLYPVGLAMPPIGITPQRIFISERRAGFRLEKKTLAFLIDGGHLTADRTFHRPLSPQGTGVIRGASPRNGTGVVQITRADELGLPTGRKEHQQESRRRRDLLSCSRFFERFFCS